MKKDGRIGIGNTAELFVKMVEFQKHMLDKHSEECMNYKDFMRGLFV